MYQVVALRDNNGEWWKDVPFLELPMLDNYPLARDNCPAHKKQYVLVLSDARGESCRTRENGKHNLQNKKSRESHNEKNRKLRNLNRGNIGDGLKFAVESCDVHTSGLCKGRSPVQGIESSSVCVQVSGYLLRVMALVCFADLNHGCVPYSSYSMFAVRCKMSR